MMQDRPSSIYSLTGFYFASLEGQAPDLSLRFPLTLSKPPQSARPPTPFTPLTPLSNVQMSMASSPSSVYGRASAISDLEKSTQVTEEWKPDKAVYMTMLTMAVLSLMVALDATILVTVLPVCLFSLA